jgi:ParB family chromosome partitioning protein
VQERSEHITEWARIVETKRKAAEEVSVQVGQKPQGGRPEGGVSAAARDLNLERKAVGRAIKIAEIAPEAKEAARAAGIANNQRALLKADASGQAQMASAVVLGSACGRGITTAGHGGGSSSSSRRPGRTYQRRFEIRLGRRRAGAMFKGPISEEGGSITDTAHPPEDAKRVRRVQPSRTASSRGHLFS